MDEGALRELADSILKHGVVQPVVVRKLADGDYEIIANFSFGVMPYERVYKQMKLFAEKVIPQLKASSPSEAVPAE